MMIHSDFDRPGSDESRRPDRDRRDVDRRAGQHDARTASGSLLGNLAAPWNPNPLATGQPGVDAAMTCAPDRGNGIEGVADIARKRRFFSRTAFFQWQR